MAKSQSKEPSLPVIVALVFFIVATIGLGVFVSVLDSAPAARGAEVGKAREGVAAMRGPRRGSGVLGGKDAVGAVEQPGAARSSHADDTSAAHQGVERIADRTDIFRRELGDVPE